MPLTRSPKIAFSILLGLFNLAYLPHVLAADTTTSSSNAATSSSSASSSSSLNTITVDGTATDDSDAATDPKKKKVSMGALGDKRVLDVPYSVSTVSKDMLDRPEVSSDRDALRYLPFVQGDGIRPQTRGIQGSVAQNSMIDGLNMVSTTAYSANQFQEIQVLNGLGGSLYGPANPAGQFNYVSKRPTDFTSTDLSVGGRTGMSGFAAGDFNNPLGNYDHVKYRLTTLSDQGNGYVSNSQQHRELVSLATDFHFTDATVLETNMTYYDYLHKGFPGTFTITSGHNFPSAARVAKYNWGKSWAGDDNKTLTASGHLKHQINDDWKIDGGLLRQIADRNQTNLTNAFSGTNDGYTVTGGRTFNRFTINSYMLNVMGDVYTGSIKHDLTFGIRGLDWKIFGPTAGNSSYTFGTGTMEDMVDFDKPSLNDTKHLYRSSVTTQSSYLASDTITFTPKWSLLVSASQNYLDNDGYSKTGTRSSSSHQKGASGSSSIMFKPIPDLMYYVTYADSLQLGDTAPSTALNADEMLDPYRSKEWETGAKWGLDHINLSLAAFQIKRPYAYTTASGYYENVGEQRNRGIEFMGDGYATKNLRLFGGITYLNPKLINTASESTDNTWIVGLPKYAANLLTVYQIPQVPGLSVDLNSRYVGRRSASNTEDEWVGGFTTFDVGASYKMPLSKATAVFHVGISNLTNKAYWNNVTAGNGGYTGTGTVNASLGEPRMVNATVGLKF